MNTTREKAWAARTTRPGRSAAPPPGKTGTASAPPLAEPAAVAVSSVMDAALYRDGRRVATPSSLAEAYAQLRAEPGAMAWIGLYRPSEAELV
jgi:magnesium transporter